MKKCQQIPLVFKSPKWKGRSCALEMTTEVNRQLCHKLNKNCLL